MRTAYLKYLRKKYKPKWVNTTRYGWVIMIPDKYGNPNDMYLSAYEFIHMSLILESRFMASYRYKTRKLEIIRKQRLKNTINGSRARSNR